MVSGGFAAAITNGTLTSGTANPILYINNYSPAADPLTIGAVIADDAGTPVSLVTTGAGSLTLTGSDTYTGSTTIAGGTVQIGSGAAAATFLTGGAFIGFNASLQYNTTSSGTMGPLTTNGGNFSNNNSASTITLAETGSNTFANIGGVSGATIIMANNPLSSTAVTGSFGVAGETIKLTGGALMISATNLANEFRIG